MKTIDYIINTPFHRINLALFNQFCIEDGLEASPDLIEYMKYTPWNTNVTIVKQLLGVDSQEDSKILVDWISPFNCDNGASDEPDWYASLFIKVNNFNPSDIKNGDELKILQRSGNQEKTSTFTVGDIYEGGDYYEYFAETRGNSYGLIYDEYKKELYVFCCLNDPFLNATDEWILPEATYDCSNIEIKIVNLGSAEK